MAVIKQRSFAVVTGASTGIGYHLARVFAQNGFDVLVTADEDQIYDAAREIEALGAKVYSVKADLSKYEEVRSFLWLASRQALGRRANFQA
jgi:uncharacterized protein